MSDVRRVPDSCPVRYHLAATEQNIQRCLPVHQSAAVHLQTLHQTASLHGQWQFLLQRQHIRIRRSTAYAADLLHTYW